MKKNTVRCHFIPKVYLRKWYAQCKTKETNELFCFDYIKNEFYKSKYGKYELGLNDELFQENRLYNQDYEEALSRIEDHYNSWLGDIERYYAYTKDMIYHKVEDIEKDKEEITDILTNFNYACKRMLYFAFVQWIRFPNEKQRYILFDFFKNVIIKHDTDYLQLFTRDFIKLGNSKGIIASTYPGDKDVYKYAFEYLDYDKLNDLENSDYRVLIDYSDKGEFITTTNPVTPLFMAERDLPYGILLPLSPNIMLRIVEKQGFPTGKEDSLFALPCTCRRQDVLRMNQTVCLYNPESKIIAGNQFIAKNVFNEIRIETILRVHSDVKEKIDRLNKNNNILYLDLTSTEEK